MEEDFIDFKCPHCGGDASFPQSASGQAQECPNCQETFVVPRAGETVARRLPLPAQGPRVALRRLQFRDANDFANLFLEEPLAAFTPLAVAGEPEVEQWLAKDAEMRFTTPNEPFQLAITLRGDAPAVIGWTLLYVEPHFRREAALQIVIGTQHQRQGFGTEALAALLEFCFTGIRLHRVTAECDARNEGARRLLEKAGLRREAEFVESRWDGHSWATILCFAMLDREGVRGAPPQG